MNDPHVEKLIYSVAAAVDHISYSEPEPIQLKNELAKFDLKDGTLEVTPADHYPTEESARDFIDPYLKAWEIQTDVTSNLGAMEFKFVRADIIDREPSPPGTHNIQAETGIFKLTGHPVTLSITCKYYPEPPEEFLATSAVQIAHARWKGYLEGKESLQGMAYFMLTILEREFGDRRGLASNLKISKKVLDKLGRIVSERGDENTARKAPSKGNFEPLTAPERAYVEQLSKELIHRTGQHAAGRILELLTLTDLPN